MCSPPILLSLRSIGLPESRSPKFDAGHLLSRISHPGVVPNAPTKVLAVVTNSLLVEGSANYDLVSPVRSRLAGVYNMPCGD